MRRVRRIEYRRVGAMAALLGLSVVLAACGSSASKTTTPASASGSTTAASGSASSTAAAPAAAAKGTAVAITSGAKGRFLTGAGGRALYLWVADAHGKSNCSGGCAQAWPPLTTKSKPSGSHGVTASRLGTIKRSDGSLQVTYGGHPLYYFAGDPSSGSTNGQGSNQFGAKWWLVSPAGAAITSSGATSSGGSSSSSSSSSGY